MKIASFLFFIKLSLSKKPGEISQVQMVNPTVKKNKSYYLKFKLFI